MDVVDLLLGAQCVHVGVYPAARSRMHHGQLPTFPFGQRVHHLGSRAAETLYGKGYGVFRPVEVVVEARLLHDGYRGRYAKQRQLRRQVVLEHVLDLFYGLFGVFAVGYRICVSVGKYQHCRKICKVSANVRIFA